MKQAKKQQQNLFRKVKSEERARNWLCRVELGSNKRKKGKIEGHPGESGAGCPRKPS